MQHLLDCPACAQLVLADTPHCPFCGARMQQGSVSALGLGLTFVLGAATAGCTVNKTGDTQSTGSASSTSDGGSTTSSESTVGTTGGTTTAVTTGGTIVADTTTDDPTTGNTTTDDSATVGTSTSTSTTGSTSFDPSDSDAAAASYAGPDEQDQTDKL